MKTITSNTERQSISRLTAMQRQVLAYFNSMNDEAQRDVISMVASIAQGSPRQRPRLCVMVGGVA